MDKKISLATALEILELRKKQIILNKDNSDYNKLQKKLQDLETKRDEILKGNQDVIKEILNEYRKEKTK